MLDAVVANEGEPSVVQISGGEPALHPDLFAILDEARARPIRHLMLDTNGRRLADDPSFAERLASYMPGFEVYLQFDSLRGETLRKLRGADLAGVRRRAIDALNRHRISTTLVVVLETGVNDGEIGEVLDFALAQPCVRGVTFQPVQAAGRLDGFDAEAGRLTLGEVRGEVLRQHALFRPQDLVPVPCHPDAICMGYAVRRRGRMVPLSDMVDPRALLGAAANTISFEQDEHLRRIAARLFSASASPASAAHTLNAMCCLPFLPKGAKPIAYDEVFRTIILQFMDAHGMDLRSLKRSCVHIVHPDGRLIPFETYNLFHRDGARFAARCGGRREEV